MIMVKPPNEKSKINLNLKNEPGRKMSVSFILSLVVLLSIGSLISVWSLVVFLNTIQERIEIF